MVEKGHRRCRTPNTSGVLTIWLLRHFGHQCSFNLSNISAPLTFESVLSRHRRALVSDAALSPFLPKRTTLALFLSQGTSETDAVHRSKRLTPQRSHTHSKAQLFLGQRTDRRRTQGHNKRRILPESPSSWSYPLDIPLCKPLSESESSFFHCYAYTLAGSRASITAPTSSGPNGYGRQWVPQIQTIRPNRALRRCRLSGHPYQQNHPT